MAHKRTKPIHWVCEAAEVVGFDLFKGGMARREMHIRGGCEYCIGEAINTGRAFIVRRVEKPVPPYTHLVTWPGTGLFLCRLTEGAQRDLSSK